MAQQRPATGGASTEDLINSTPDERADRAAAIAPEKAAVPDTSGKRFRAIADHGGTTVTVSKGDFHRHDIEHDDVTWDFRKDFGTVKIGDGKGQITEEAAEFLHKLEPMRFEFMD